MQVSWDNIFVSYKYMNFFEQEAACVGDTIDGTGAAGPNQSFRSVPYSSHQPHSASASQTSVLHNLLPSLTSSVYMSPFDANVSHNSATIQPSSLVKVNPTLLPPVPSTQTTAANAASSMSVLPPLHPPLGSHQLQSVPLHHHPFSLPTASLPHHMACLYFNHSHHQNRHHCLPQQHLMSQY